MLARCGGAESNEFAESRPAVAGPRMNGEAFGFLGSLDTAAADSKPCQTGENRSFNEALHPRWCTDGPREYDVWPCHGNTSGWRPRGYLM